jgi:hypothetical protein
VTTADERDLLGKELSRIAEEYAEQLDRAGTSLDDVGGVDGVAGLVRAVLPRFNRFVARVGPVYTTGQLQRLLPGAGAGPISDEAVRDRARKGRLIGFRTADRRWAWPAWQFRVQPGRLAPREEVLALWRLLPADGPDELTRVAWLTGAHDDLDGRSPLAHLDAAGLDDRVTAAAHRWAARAG